MTDDEKYIEHEVQLRLLNLRNQDVDKRLDLRNQDVDKRFESVDKRFDILEQKIDSHFKWTLGIMITIFGSLILTKFI